MFSGSWKESTMEKIDIHIIDPNIDLNALHIALGSLYQDEITVEPADVIPILAAASLFQVCTYIQYIMSCERYNILSKHCLFNSESILQHYFHSWKASLISAFL